MRAYLTKQIASSWPDFEERLKMAALWYDSLILAKSFEIDAILARYSSDADAVRSVLRPFPKITVKSLPLNVANDVLAKLQRREREMWEAYAKGITEHADVEDDVDDDERSPAFIPSGLANFARQLDAARSAGALATFGTEIKLSTDLSTATAALSEALSLNASTVISTPIERDLIGELETDQRGIHALSYLSEVVRINIPDLSRFSWSDIVRLRDKYDQRDIRRLFKTFFDDAKFVHEKGGREIHRSMRAQRRQLVRDVIEKPLVETGKIWVKAAPGVIPVWGNIWSLVIAGIDSTEVWNRRRRLMLVSFLNDLEEIGDRSL